MSPAHSLSSLVTGCEWPLREGGECHILFPAIGWSADALEANSVMEEVKKRERGGTPNYRG